MKFSGGSIRLLYIAVRLGWIRSAGLMSSCGSVCLDDLNVAMAQIAVALRTVTDYERRSAE